MAKNRIVYSTDSGRMCPDCGEPRSACRCSQQHSVTEGDGIVRLQRQVKGRNGKPVTLITGLGLTDKDLKPLAKTLKKKCGVGGSIEQGNILIQGDMRNLLKSELESQGYTVKISGG